MTISVVYANLSAQADTKNAAVTLFSPTNFGPAETRTEQGGRVKVSEYTFKGANPGARTYLSIRQETTKEGGKRNSVRIATDVTVTDDVADTTRVEQHEAVIAWNHPGPYLIDSDQMSVLVQAAFSIIMTTFNGSTGEPSNVVLEDINYGITNNI
jgi:hypothetical protein